MTNTQTHRIAEGDRFMYRAADGSTHGPFTAIGTFTNGLGNEEVVTIIDDTYTWLDRDRAEKIGVTS